MLRQAINGGLRSDLGRRRNRSKRACFFHLHPRIDRIDIAAVRPGRDAHLDKHPGKEVRVLQRLGYRAQTHELAQVYNAHGVVIEDDLEPIAVQRLYAPRIQLERMT